MLRCMLGRVKGEKSENPKGELGNGKRGEFYKLLIKLGVIIVTCLFKLRPLVLK